MYHLVSPPLGQTLSMSPSVEEETKDQRGEVTCLVLHSWQAAEQDLNPAVWLQNPHFL